MIGGPPVVSILTTCFNRAAYLAQAIESALAQRFQDFELIVVDDASSDESVRIAESYAERDSRVKVFVNETNLGDYANRNHAASLATGTYIKYLDSDDLLYPHCLEVMVPLMDSEPSAAIGFSLVRRVVGAPAPMLLTPRMCYQREFLGSGLFFGGPGDAIFRREEFLELGGFPSAGGASDNLLWLHACARVNVLALPADLTWHRIHPGQATHTEQAAIDAAKEVAMAWRAINSPECPLTPEEVPLARRSVVRRLAGEILTEVRSRRWSRVGMRFRESGIPFPAILQYLRPLERDVLAGTPLDAAGEYFAPDWSKYRRPNS